MADKQFVHLHLHTDYSLLDGAIQIKKLAAKAAEMNMPAVAMTDHGNMFGAISFYSEMKKVGVKPIIGCEVYVARGDHRDRGEPDRPKGMNHLILLATNLAGYRNLVKLTSYGYTHGYYYKPRIDRDLLAAHSEGLVGLSACLSGVPSQLVMHEQFDEAERQSLLFNEILGQGNYFLEVQKQAGIDVQDRVNKGLFDISRRTGIPLAVTNDSHFLNREDFDAHSALLSIGTGKPLSQGGMHYSPDHYFRSQEEMWQLFGRDLPEPGLALGSVDRLDHLARLRSGEAHVGDVLLAGDDPHAAVVGASLGVGDDTCEGEVVETVVVDVSRRSHRVADVGRAGRIAGDLVAALAEVGEIRRAELLRAEHDVGLLRGVVGDRDVVEAVPVDVAGASHREADEGAVDAGPVDPRGAGGRRRREVAALDRVVAEDHVGGADVGVRALVPEPSADHGIVEIVAVDVAAPLREGCARGAGGIAVPALKRGRLIGLGARDEQAEHGGRDGGGQGSWQDVVQASYLSARG